MEIVGGVAGVVVGPLFILLPLPIWYRTWARFLSENTGYPREPEKWVRARVVTGRCVGVAVMLSAAAHLLAVTRGL